MAEPLTLAIIFGTFLAAGLVKGVIGMGLPTVSLALLTVTLGLPQAMALLLVPSLVTNLWQAAVGGNGRVLVKRLWPFLALAAVFVPVGALVFGRVSSSVLTGLLGVLLIAYALIGLFGVRMQISGKGETPAGIAAGVINGVLTGMTGSFVVPGVMYLQAIGLGRDQLVQAMGLLFTVSTLALAVGLAQNQLLTASLGLLSTAGVIPALFGMVAGQWVRGRVSESRFRQIFLVALLLLGLQIVVTAVV